MDGLAGLRTSCDLEGVDRDAVGLATFGFDEIFFSEAPFPMVGFAVTDLEADARIRALISSIFVR